MRHFITVIAIALATMGFAHAAGSATAGQGKAGMCMGCHGMDGNSMVPMFPSLAGQNERYIAKQLADTKSGARVINEMTALVGMLQQQDFEDLGAFYATQTIKPGQAGAADQVALGKSIYMGGNVETGVTACAACHSPTGAGNSGAGFPSLEGQHATYVAAQLRKFRLGARHSGAATAEVRTNDGDTRMMRDIAFKLKDFEIDALAAYIAGM